jgi:hypothetical protein
MKFRKKPVVIEAEQWFPGKHVGDVKEVAPELIFSKKGEHYYLSAAFPRMSDAWLPVTEGEILPFAFWEVKSGECRPAGAGDPLVERYLRHMGADALPAAYGLVETLEGRMKVTAGDWVITGVAGEKYPCKPEIFAATYEAAE